MTRRPCSASTLHMVGGALVGLSSASALPADPVRSWSVADVAAAETVAEADGIPDGGRS